MSTAELIDLDRADALDPAVVGRKAATLARLRGAGLPVPDGLVLSVGLCRRWQRDPAVLATIADRLPGPWAVRSSGLDEDGPTRAAAGTLATVLDVDGIDALVEAVAAVIASADPARVAVLVQPLLAPDQAGVAFTVDPLTGDRDVVRIAATTGRGDAVTDGRTPGTDLTVRPGGAVEGDLGVLAPGPARDVAALARQAELLLGGPQDVEWARCGGVVHLLQSRPVTVVPVPPAMPEGYGWEKDVAHYPEPVTPFGWSVFETAEEHAIAATFPQVGLLMARFEQQLVGGQVYTRPVLVVGPADPGPSPSDPPPAAVLGALARIHPALRRRTAAARRALADDLPHRWLTRWPSEWRPRLRRSAAALRAEDPADLADEALAAHLDRGLALQLEAADIHFKLMIPYALDLHALHRFLDGRLGWTVGQTFRLMAGHSPASTAGERTLAPVRDRIAALPGSAAALAATPEDPVGAIRTLDDDTATALEDWLETHGGDCVNYDPGRPVLAEQPRMVTHLLLGNPTPLDGAAATARTAEADARAALPAGDVDDFDRLLAAARRVYPVREENTRWTDAVPGGLLRRALVAAGDRLAARGAIADPADASYLTVEEVRMTLRGAGDTDLVAAALRRRGEEAWARANPGPTTIGAPSGPPPDLSRLPAALRAVNEPVLWMVGLEYPGALAGAEPTGEVLLRGVPASPGVVEAPVRVVRGHADLGRLQPGEVLVCGVTTPAWATMFGLAGAIVADGGGVLSHAAIAAREHGLPAVLGTGTATIDLTDGQVVRVDGTSGTVSPIG